MTKQIQSILGENASVILLGLKRKTRCVLLRGRIRKEDFVQKIVQVVSLSSTYWCCLCGKLCLGSVWNCGCCTELTFCSIVASYFEGFFLLKRKMDTRSLNRGPYLLLTVSLEQIFHVNTEEGERLHLLPNCPVRWEVCSRLSRSLSFGFSYHLAPHPFCFSYWFTTCQRQLTLPVWPHREL